MGIYKEIIKINKELGGVLLKPSILEFACDKASYEKNVYKKVAYVIRAVVVDHCFLDFNKSSATIMTKRILERKNIICNEKRLVRKMIKIARENIQSIAKIEKMVRKCCQKKK